MADATTSAAAETGQGQAGPLPVPLVLLMMDVMQARGRDEAVARLVDEIYARADGAAE
jgi:hypothetical protein